MVATTQDYFRDKSILITGGTGSFGNQIVSRLVLLSPKRVIVFSRDEEKQYWMQRRLEAYRDRLEFVIGDVRQYSRVFEVMRGVDVVYHAAALKQVPNNEDYPMEAVQTNVIGAENIRRAAIERNVDVVVSISTDKAVKPVNVMGMTKALQERIFLSPTNTRNEPRFVCVRYGNVIGSRGSVVPLFRDRIKEGKPLPVTSFKMTRFLLRLEEAVDLVVYATLEGSSGSLIVQKMPACYIKDLAFVMGKDLTGRDDYPIEEVGIRAGEKIHEVLVSEDEMRRADERPRHYIIKPFSRAGELKKDGVAEYASNTTTMLNTQEISKLLQKDGWIGIDQNPKE